MKRCNNCANLSQGGDCDVLDCEWSDKLDAPTKWKPIKDNKPDNINHPSHYETGRFECFDVMVEAIGVEETKGFCLCNAFKYIYRCKIKHETPTEDIKKAIWYLNKFVELEEAEGG